MCVVTWMWGLPHSCTYLRPVDSVASSLLHRATQLYSLTYPDPVTVCSVSKIVTPSRMQDPGIHESFQVVFTLPAPLRDLVAQIRIFTTRTDLPQNVPKTQDPSHEVSHTCLNQCIDHNS